MLTVINDDGSTRDGSPLDGIVREGPRWMLATALEAEANAYIAEFADEAGRRLVVRNGHHQPRKRFFSAILPPWARKSPKIGEVLPLLYLHGLSSGDFVPALEQFLGTAAGPSPACGFASTRRRCACWCS